MSTSLRSARAHVRLARESDAAQIAKLSGQLGYPSTTEDILRRMRSLEPAALHAVLVAESPAGEVIGWGHVSVNHLIENDVRAELNGLVVAEGQRSLGAGQRILEQAEKWARERGCRALHLRSNVIRTRAHQFYERQGYEHYKTQKAFRKVL
jgi:GNAT superfamily N-acetyltransferase